VVPSFFYVAFDSFLRCLTFNPFASTFFSPKGFTSWNTLFLSPFNHADKALKSRMEGLSDLPPPSRRWPTFFSDRPVVFSSCSGASFRNLFPVVCCCLATFLQRVFLPRTYGTAVHSFSFPPLVLMADFCTKVYLPLRWVFRGLVLFFFATARTGVPFSLYNRGG